MRSVPMILLISLCTFATFAGEISEFDLQSQFIGAAITNRGYRRSFTEANGENDSQLLVRHSPAAAWRRRKRWLRLVAQQSLRTERSQNPVQKMNVKC